MIHSNEEVEASWWGLKEKYIKDCDREDLLDIIRYLYNNQERSDAQHQLDMNHLVGKW